MQQSSSSNPPADAWSFRSGGFKASWASLLTLLLLGFLLPIRMNRQGQGQRSAFGASSSSSRSGSNSTFGGSKRHSGPPSPSPSHTSFKSRPA
ncbi:hypothetical protein B0A53_06478 [Rhodotorula sp. CCFEE 5036]|nr:hypothetical protein B0A53_06478 [Rhodotorula sp. CCFEE 5036]